MDRTRFDTWTRRRFGFAIGSASFLGLADLMKGDAGKKKRKRCKHFGAGCTPHGKRKCCHKLQCKSAFPDGENGPTICCKPEGAPCSLEAECCWPAFCSETCLINSDRAVKTNVSAVDPAVILAHVQTLSILSWQDRDTESVRHVGPAAREFAAAFDVGRERCIRPVDGQGVALAAIQSLAAIVDDLRVERSAFAERIAALENGLSYRDGAE